MNELEEIRGRINSIDSKIADLFEQRMKESRGVAEYKIANGLSITDSAREAEVIERNSKLIKDDTVREYYINFQHSLMDISKEYQRRVMKGMKVAYCGVPGAFAYVAASRMFPNAELVSYADFEEAYKACADGECDSVVLPFENSFAGEVSAVTDLMFSGNLNVNQVIGVEAVQSLLGVEGASLDTIKKVYSHPQALSQCAPFIRSRQYETKEFGNTAGAAKYVAGKNDPTLAAIANEECAELYGLKVIEHAINSSSTNTTRFAAFSRASSGDASHSRMGKRFILMFTVKNESGALAKMLNIIGAHGYNMCCLRSRPMKNLMWKYYFFIEADGDINTEDGKSMLVELGSICDRLKLVGSYFVK